MSKTHTGSTCVYFLSTFFVLVSRYVVTGVGHRSRRGVGNVVYKNLKMAVCRSEPRCDVRQPKSRERGRGRHSR